MELRHYALFAATLFVLSCTAEIRNEVATDAGEGRIDASLESACGNGKVESPEECDDGNQSDTDACLSSCQWARCGDGIVRTGVEECDDEREQCMACTFCPGPHPEGKAGIIDGSCVFEAPGGRHRIDDARNLCSSYGAMLWSPHSAANRQAVGDRFFADVDVAHGIWIGVSKPANPADQWFYETGYPVEDDYWSCCGGELGNEPNYLDTEHCVEAIFGTLENTVLDGRWNNLPCSYEVSTLCEKLPWRESDDHHAYKLFVDSKSWDDAEESCVRLGGHLASVHSLLEDDLIEELAAREVWLGARRDGPESGFTWTTTEPVTHENWLGGLSGDEDCVAKKQTGWITSPCTAAYAYICEI